MHVCRFLRCFRANRDPAVPEMKKPKFFQNSCPSYIIGFWVGFWGVLWRWWWFSVPITLTCKLAGGYFPVPPSLRHNFSTWSPNWETMPSIIKQSESHLPLEQKVARIGQSKTLIPASQRNRFPPVKTNKKLPWVKESNKHTKAWLGLGMHTKEISEAGERCLVAPIELLKEVKIEILKALLLRETLPWPFSFQVSFLVVLLVIPRKRKPRFLRAKNDHSHTG